MYSFKVLTSSGEAPTELSPVVLTRFVRFLFETVNDVSTITVELYGVIQGAFLTP